MHNFSELHSELMFLKYNKTGEIKWSNFKGMYRPEKIFTLSGNWSNLEENYVHVMVMPKRIGHFR